MTTFEHGNLPRGARWLPTSSRLSVIISKLSLCVRSPAGVCPIAEFSQTLIGRVGYDNAASFYLTNRILTALGALCVHLTHKVCYGIQGAQQCARELSSLLAATPSLSVQLADQSMLVHEAIGHATCLLENAGHATPTLAAASGLTPVIVWEPGVIGEGSRCCTWLQRPAAFVLHDVGGLDQSATTIESPDVRWTALLNALSDETQGMPTVALCDERWSSLSSCDADVVLVGADASFTSQVTPLVHTVSVGELAVGMPIHACSIRAVCALLVRNGDLSSAEAARLGMAEAVGITDELGAEAARFQHVLSRVGSWLLRRLSPALRTGLQSQPSVLSPSRQMEAATTYGMRLGLGAGLAVIDLAACSAGNMAGLRTALDWLSALGPSLRAICINLAGARGTEARLCSVRALEQCGHMIHTLRALTVPVVCSATVQLNDLSLLTWRAAEYRTVDVQAAHQRVAIATGHRVGDASMPRFALLGSACHDWAGQLAEDPTDANDGLDTSMKALQFAAWMASHAPVGLEHMLALTRRPLTLSSKSIRCASRVAALVKAAMLRPPQTGAETKLELQQSIVGLEPADRSKAVAKSVSSGNLSSQLLLPSNAGSNISHRRRETSSFGIHALEVYIPGTCVSAPVMETAASSSSTRTHEILLERYTCCDDGEDIVSTALTCVRRLLRRCHMQSTDIGMIQLSCAALPDRSKCITARTSFKSTRGGPLPAACDPSTWSSRICDDWFPGKLRGSLFVF